MGLRQDQGPATPSRTFGFAGGKDFNFSPWHFALSSYGNMLRNGGFESWSQGQSARPDAWQVTSNGMTYIRSLSEYHGGYCIKITKHEDDGDLNVTRRIYMQPGVIQPGILNASIYHAP